MITVSIVRVFILTFLLHWPLEAAIYRRASRNVANTGDGIPIETLAKELYRYKRSDDGPSTHEVFLHDSNDRGIVYYTGNGSQLIFVVTYLSSNLIGSTQVYRSDDYGVTFYNINDLISNETGTKYVNQLYISPEDSQRVYLLNMENPTIYLSSDGGVTFTTRTITPDRIDTSTFVVHPTVEDWVLAKSKENDLYVSTDFGRSPFRKIASNVEDYRWGITPYDADSTIFYTVSTNGLYNLYTQRLPFSDSMSKEFDPVLGAHDDFTIIGRYMFAQKTTDGVVSLWVSVDRKPFKQAKIPSNEGHRNYIVDNIRSIQAMVVVQHTNGIFNLYMSEEQGELYYLALDNIVVSDQFVMDLETIESMNHTTYIANQNALSGDVAETLTRTLISFDIGANWEPLTPPTSYDECIQPLCSLHLHMSTSEYWRTGVYSQESAPGIIIAHGSTGQYLTDDNTNLFISRDGGSTWSKTLDGTWGVSVLDLGGLIVAARDYHAGLGEQSRVLKYSCDEGSSWINLTFTNRSIVVFAVITEPGETTTVISLYGIHVPTLDWAVVTVDFDHVFPRLCGQADYYGWTPFDDNTGTGCLLGASVTVERRRPSVCCKNGLNYNREISYRICECSQEDFECDYGYKHLNGISGACIRDEDVTLSEKCGSDTLTYFESQGYHKIPGDVCKGGVEDRLTAYEVPCCNATTFHSISTVIETVTTDVYLPSPMIIVDESYDGRSLLIGVLIIVLIVCMCIIGIFTVAFIAILIFKRKRTRSPGGGYTSVPSVTYHNTDRDTSPMDVSEQEDDPMIPM